MNELVIRVIAVIGFIVLAPFIGGILDGFDRKISARMQRRVGPKVTQPFYDVMKLLNKEFVSVNKSQLFLLVSYLLFTIFAGVLFFAGFDMLMVFLCTSTAAMFMIMAASTTHTAYTGVGTARELLQMMCCEPMELLVAIGFYLASTVGRVGNGTGTFLVSELIKGDRPAIVYLPGFFIGFVFILTIKFRKSPFDISTSHHAHQEVVKGVTAEFSGGAYALVEIAEWYEQVMLLSVVGLFFVTSNPISWIFAILAVLVVYFLEIIIDNTSARVKWDLMFKMSWGVIFVFGGINLVVLEGILRTL